LQQKEVPTVGAVLQCNSRAHRHEWLSTDLLPDTKREQKDNFCVLSEYTLLCFWITRCLL